MPYYNQLYKSELIEFNPLHDVDVTRSHNRTVDGTENKSGETSDTDSGTRDITGTTGTKETGSDSTTTNSNGNATKKDLYSDTPQGALTGVENESRRLC